MSSASSDPSPTAPRFTLPVAAWIAWGLYVAFALVQFARADGQHNAFETSRLIVNVGGTLILPAVLAWIAWRFTDYRPLTRTLTFFAAFACVVVVQLIRAHRSDQADSNLARAKQEQRPRAAETHARKVGAAADRQKTNRFTERTMDHLRGLAQKASGNDRGIAQAAQAVTAEFVAANRRYNEALATLNVATFFTLSSTLTEERIEARRQAVNEFIEANTHLQSVETGGALRLRRELDLRGVPAATVRSTLAGYEESTAPRIPLLLKVRDADAQLAEAMLDFLDLAAGRQGAWKAEEGTTTVTFENRATREHYNELLERVRTITAEQSEYQQRLVELTQ